MDKDDNAKRELRLLRRDVAQPWRRWPARIGNAIVAGVMRFLRGLGEILAEVVGEVLMWWVIFAVLLALGILGAWLFR